jgi:hypothetical protein
MQIQIQKHTIEYHWDDRLTRELDCNSIDIIVHAIGKGHNRGSFRQQDDDGNWSFCNWKDVTDNDILTFGLIQGWFK